MTLGRAATSKYLPLPMSVLFPPSPAVLYQRKACMCSMQGGVTHPGMGRTLTVAAAGAQQLGEGFRRPKMQVRLMGMTGRWRDHWLEKIRRKLWLKRKICDYVCYGEHACHVAQLYLYHHRSMQYVFSFEQGKVPKDLKLHSFQLWVTNYKKV